MAQSFATLFFCVCIVFGQDFEIKVTHSALNELLDYAVPTIISQVSSQTIPEQTINDVVDLTIGPIDVKTFDLDMIILPVFTETEPTMHAEMSNLSISFYPFPLVVERQLTNAVGLKCNFLISASFTEWYFGVCSGSANQ